MKFDPYGTLMINHGNRILILFHLYCNSKHELSTILIANVANLSRFVTLTDFDSKNNSSPFVYFICTYYFGYWIITIMGLVSMNASSETQGQIVGARESLNGRENMARKKVKNG